MRVQKEPDDTVMTWPHLLSIEFFAAAVMSIFLLLMGVFVNAPLEELANPNVTPAVAKAPWYFVGLQELLAYFHPTVAGVLGVTVILVGAASSRTSTAARRATAARPARATARWASCCSRMFCGVGPGHHLPRRVLPRPGLRLVIAVGRRPVLRAVMATD